MKGTWINSDSNMISNTIMAKFVLLSLSAMFFSCTSPNSSSKELSFLDNSNDSIETAYLYSDSIDNIIDSSNVVNFYLMMGLVRDSIDAVKKDLLFNYQIEKKIGELSKTDLDKMKILIDPKLYMYETSPIRQPFNPNYVLEFSKDDMKAFYWVSLGTGEIALSDSKGNFKCFIMRDFERIDSLFRNVIKNK